MNVNGLVWFFCSISMATNAIQMPQQRHETLFWAKKVIV